MSEGLNALSEREKETLRLLLGGHDAKSIARSQGLSVHTVNERLRDARRKLGVSSSREAARLLDEVERGDPKLLVDKRFGVVATTIDRKGSQHSDQRQKGERPLFWLGGGMLIMSFIIAAIMLSSAHGNGEAQSSPVSNPMPAAIAPDSVQSPAATSAGMWVLLLDKQRWDESWDAAGALFKSQMPKAQWASTIQPVRQPLGLMSSRTIQSATKASSLPGAPAGDYEIVVFKTNFVRKPDAIETVVLAREGASWRVNGYFIR